LVGRSRCRDPAFIRSHSQGFAPTGDLGHLSF
jgi:hypothetical protein